MIPTRYHVRLLIDALLVAGISFALLIAALAISVVTQFDGNAEFPIDCAIVFGAAVHGTDRAGPGITRRVMTAGDLYQEQKINRVFLTGGKGDENKKSEAEVMKKVAMLAGVDPEVITLEGKSKSTLQNIRNVKPLVQDCDSIVAISDRYHLARIRWLAAREHLHRQVQVHPANKNASFLFEFRATMRETFAFLYLAVVLYQENQIVVDK